MRKSALVLLASLAGACASSEKAAHGKPDPNKAATTSTGLTMVDACTMDIGAGGILLPHKEGIRARDRDGNDWVSRKNPKGSTPGIAFYPAP